MMRLRKSGARRVLDLLEAQQKALLDGNLEVLDPMAAELEKAFNRLHRDKGAQAELTEIKDMAQRNARLLLAAQAGVASARASLTSSRATKLTTYGADGQSQPGSQGSLRPVVRR